MSYSPKYYANIWSQLNRPTSTGQTYQVALLKNNWLGTANEIKQYAFDALKLNYINDGDKENITPIIGSNVDFSFYAKSGDTVQSLQFPNTGFTNSGTILPWTSISTAGETPWIWHTGNYIQSDGSVNGTPNTAILYTQNNYGLPYPAGVYTFSITMQNLSAGGGSYIPLIYTTNDYILNNANFLSPTSSFSADSITRNFQASFTLPTACKAIGFSWNKTGSVAGIKANIKILNVSIVSGPNTGIPTDYDGDLMSSDYKDWLLEISKTYFNITSGKTISSNNSTGLTVSSMGAGWSTVSGLRQTTISGATNVMTTYSTLNSNSLSSAYSVFWNASARTDTLTNGVLKSGMMNTDNFGNMPVRVKKTNNAGKAQANGQIIYTVNTGTVHTTNFISGATVDDSYSFLSASTNASLEASITENLPANTITGGTFTVFGNGGNTAPINLAGGSIVGNLSSNPIFAGSTTHVTVTPVSSFAANTTSLTFTLNGGHPISTNTNSLNLVDKTTNTTYTGTVTGGGTSSVTVTFSISPTGGHKFFISGTYSFNAS